MSKLTLTVIGHLGRDCSIRYFDNGQSAITFPIASTDKYKDKAGNAHEHTTWIDCTIWRKPDNIKIAEYLKKGTQLYLEGKPAARGYKAKSSDEIHASLQLKVEVIQFVGIKPASASTQNSAPEATAETTMSTESAPAVFSSQAQEDDLPF
jgi:single-strand DNA-binding protein